MKRNENGQIAQMYSDEQFIEIIQQNGNTTAPEVAAHLGCNKKVATNRLKVLVEAGHIKSRKVSGRWVFWC